MLYNTSRGRPVMHTLDADQVWWLFEIVVTHCTLVCYFGGFIFLHVCFSPQNVQNTLCSTACEAPGRSDDCVMKGLSISLCFAAWWHYTSVWNVHAATLRLKKSHLWTPKDVLYFYTVCVCSMLTHYASCCLLCEAFLFSPLFLFISENNNITSCAGQTSIINKQRRCC